MGSLHAQLIRSCLNNVRGTTLLYVPEFLTPEAPHRVRYIRADWDTLVTKIDVGQEIRYLKGWKDGA
jgi:hypothetical protein